MCQNEQARRFADVDRPQIVEVPKRRRRARCHIEDRRAIESRGDELGDLVRIDPGVGRVAEIGSVEHGCAGIAKRLRVLECGGSPERGERRDDGAVRPSRERLLGQKLDGHMCEDVGSRDGAAMRALLGERVDRDAQPQKMRAIDHRLE